MFEDIRAIQKTNEHTAIILKELRESAGLEDNNTAFVVLRATMKALRDRIDPGEAMDLAAQLPALLRGFYMEGYDFSDMTKPRSNSKDAGDFIQDVKAYLDGYDYLELQSVVPQALKSILDYVDEGESEEVIHQLPKEIQQLYPH